MDAKYLDHSYHRSRVDAHISGMIGLVALIAVLALTIGHEFKPFQPGAEWLEPVRLVWVESEGGWMPQRKLVELGNYPPATNRGPLQTHDIQPIVVSIVIILGTLAASYFVYRCARRQTSLMNSVFTDGAAYQRPWEEIRVTFWGLNVTLLFILFFFMA